jgi:hypothetical protein
MIEYARKNIWHVSIGMDIPIQTERDIIAPRLQASIYS